MTLTKTGIEYGEFAWNFYPGCRHQQQGVCTVKNCWAKAMARRHGNPDFEPRLIAELLDAPLKRRKPARILVNFMGDLFGDWVNPYQPVMFQGAAETLASAVQWVVTASPQHTFLFLTKAPWNISKWQIDWPDNSWIGATATDLKTAGRALYAGLNRVQAKNKWLSLEPVRDATHIVANDLRLVGIKWVVIGAQSRPDVMPKLEWVRDIVEAADAAGVPVWEKDNLKPLLKTLRQDCPKEWKK